MYLKLYDLLWFLFIGVNVKTGEIFPATFPDKGPEPALRNARNLTCSNKQV